MENPPASAHTMRTPISSSMMSEDEEQVGWFTKFWGALVMILLIGSILGLPLWWLWARSPLRIWIKATLTALFVIGIILII
jgi:hypothetical protein